MKKKVVLAAAMAIALGSAIPAAASAEQVFAESQFSPGAVPSGPELPSDPEEIQRLLDQYHDALESGRLDSRYRVEAPTLPLLREIDRLLFEESLSPNQLDISPDTVPEGFLGKSSGYSCRDASLICVGELAAAWAVVADAPAWTSTYLTEVNAIGVAAATQGALKKINIVQVLGLIGSGTVVARYWNCVASMKGRNQSNPTVDPDCASILTEAIGALSPGNSCARANAVCGIVARPHIAITAFHGIQNGDPIEANCGGASRALGMTAGWRSIDSKDRMTLLGLICGKAADGSNSNIFVGRSERGGSTSARVCTVGTVPQGINAYYDGTSFSRIELICDQVGQNGTNGGTSDNTVGPTLGTTYSGETKKTMMCPEGKFIYGAKGYLSTSPDSKKRYLVGLSLICR